VEDIIAMAERLGKAIAACPQAKALEDARKALNADEEATRLLKDYQEQAEKIARLEDENKPVEVEDKHRLSDLQGRLTALAVFKKFTMAQVEYVDLMRRVNDAIRQQIAPADQAAGQVTETPPAGGGGGQAAPGQAAGKA